MSTLRLLHLADVHLDTPFYGRDEQWRSRLRDATRTAFTNAVDLAIERQAHVVLVAGDLFDNDLLTFSTEQFLLEQINRLRKVQIQFCYATGNHDPGRLNYRAHRLNWPDNVHIFSQNKPGQVVIIDQISGQPVGRIAGAGHLTKQEKNNLATNLKNISDTMPADLPRVALLHTQIVSARGAEKHERYAPATVEDLATTDFDYWALGHIHLRQQVARPLPAWYPGNLQGRNPRETGLKGGLWLELEKDQLAAPEFISLAPLVWLTVVAECPEAVVAVEDLVVNLSKQIEVVLDKETKPDVPVPSIQVGTHSPDGYLVRLILKGSTLLVSELRDQDNRADLARQLEERLGLDWVEVHLGTLTRPLDLPSLRQGPSVLATAMELIERATTEDELLRKMSPEHLAANPEERLPYLRRLLVDLEQELAERLVPEVER